MRYIVLTVFLLLAACSAPMPAAPPTATPFPLETILPPDAIRALEQPPTVPAAQAAAHIGPFQEVIGVAVGDEARAYPLGLMSRYEIANDTLGGKPIAVTFCPLCNSGIVVSRQVAGVADALTFAFSGKILDGALVMMDRESGSLWPQSRLMAISGELEGTQLELLPASQMPWQEWVAAHPETTLVVDEQAATRTPRDFSISALTGSSAAPAPSVAGYVLGVASASAARAFPLEAVEAQRLINGEVEGLPPFVLVALGEPGVVAAWERTHEGQALTFYHEGEQLRDQETGSVWDAARGSALSGPLEGTQLRPTPLFLTHWLGWKDLHPATSVWH